VLGETNITIADGHHRTHTALDYRDEVAAKAAKRWTGNESANFALIGLIPEDDPGLVILPIHRMLHVDALPERFLERLSALYHIETGPSTIEEAWDAVRANALGPTTFAILGVEGPHSIHIASARSQEAIDNAMPAHLSQASKRLDVVVLTETVLAPIFGID